MVFRDGYGPILFLELLTLDSVFEELGMSGILTNAVTGGREKRTKKTKEKEKEKENEGIVKRESEKEKKKKRKNKGGGRRRK